MSLLASQAMFNNTTLGDRLQAAIRKTAAERLQWAEPAGTLARAAYTAPETVAPSFLLRLATNGDVVSETCEACGHAGGVPDDTIEWIVGESWDAVSIEMYGDSVPLDPEAA